jgi:hypothetical protein
MLARTALGAALLLTLSLPAHALCRDDLADLKPRIDKIKTASPQRYGLALKWWGRAQAAEPGSEVECLNLAARARKALTDPMPEIAGCTGPNAYLPNCHDGVMQNGDAGVAPGGGPAQPIGGGAGNSVAPVGPIAPGGPTPYNPLGSVGSR